MKRLRNCILALLVGCSTPLLIWVGAGSALYQGCKRAKLLKKALPNQVCSINADCPPSYVCVDGYCVPEKAKQSLCQLGMGSGSPYRQEEAVLQSALYKTTLCVQYFWDKSSCITVELIIVKH